MATVNQRSLQTAWRRAVEPWLRCQYFIAVNDLDQTT